VQSMSEAVWDALWSSERRQQVGQAGAQYFSLKLTGTFQCEAHRDAKVISTP
jgi:hypothetical protein